MARHLDLGGIPENEWPPPIYIEAGMECYGFESVEALQTSLSREGRHELHPQDPIGRRSSGHSLEHSR